MRLAIGLLGAACMVIGGASLAEEYRPAFRPELFKGPPAGALNEVLVLASPHLSYLPQTFHPEQTGPLLDRLQAWGPTAISVESLSGLQCDSLRRHPSRYAETVREYCSDTAAAGRASGLDVPEANAEAERTLAAWPDKPSAAQRRRLALLFLAAGERPSATVQWMRLSVEERLPEDG